MQSDTAVGNKYNIFQKTDRCNYLEYSGDAVLVIYLIRVIRAIRVPKEMRNSCAEKYLLL